MDRELNTAQLLVKCLEEEEVKYIFGIPGEENLEFINALKDSDIKFITTRHEQGAAFMADVSVSYTHLDLITIDVTETVPLKKAIPLSFQHLFAMFGSSVLVPILVGIDPTTVLFFNGIGTLLYAFITKKKIPAYLGSSFAFLSPVFLLQSQGYEDVYKRQEFPEVLFVCNRISNNINTVKTISREFNKVLWREK